MRLGTLARKISITPSKLTAYLESQNIELSSGTNTKLSEEHIELVLVHFEASLEPEQPEKEIEEPVEKIVEPENETVPEETVEPIAEPVAKEVAPSPDESKEEEKEEESAPERSESFAEIALPHELEETEEKSIDEISNDEEPSEETEEIEEEYIPQIPDDLDPEIESYVEKLAYDENVKVIKPPKVKLQGLKVKGKIDLPEPKAKEEPVEEIKKEEKKAYNPDEIITTTGPKRERKRKPKNYKGKKFNKDYNPVEAARKKKEWEEKKRKEREERRKKKAKELHYKKTVKTEALAPSSKKKKSKKSTPKQMQEQQPTGNMLQRFWRWMNT